jgi:hypothetical protein
MHWRCKVNCVERLIVRHCLSAIAVDMAELRCNEGWWGGLSAENRREWQEFLAKVRQYQNDVQNVIVKPSVI